MSFLLYILQTIVDLFTYILILRFLLHAVHAHYFNPLSQFSMKLTQWLVGPVHKLFPSFKHRKFDWGILSLLLLIEILKFTSIVLLKFGGIPNFGGIIVLAIADIIEKIIIFYFYAIIIRAIVSWVAPVHQNPVYFAITQLTEPLLFPARRVIPMIGGFDLSPLVVLIVLQLIKLSVSKTFISFAGWLFAL
jgi:YggT family protein